VGTFYERRQYRPAWTSDDGPLPAARRFAEALVGASRHGLDPETYHLSAIHRTLETLAAPLGDRERSSELADLEILLTDGYVTYASHLLSGRVNPETVEPDWVARPREANLPALLESALKRDRWEESLEGLAPADPGYTRLQAVLVHYRQIAGTGGWAVPTKAPTLRPGDRDPAVSVLRRRLAAEGYVDEVGTGAMFDAALEAAVRSYQMRNGLDVDGTVGPATWGTLRIAAGDRVQQIEANLERWRWLRAERGKRYLRVNVADFRLEAVENGHTLLTMRVVVGKPAHQTPLFAGRMTYLVLNPFWNVPGEIADKEILPAVRRDASYLARHGFRVLRGWDDDAEVPPSAVDWGLKSLERAGLRIRQDPGPENALGRVKFMFPNRFNVYLHDTPSRELFERTRRDFSHGCIRVARPLDLAQYVLSGDPTWTQDAILAALDGAGNRIVPLPEPITVYVEYFTAWGDEDGVTHFRADVYGRDARLEAALFQPVPPS
jgi:murein L,D-transpeptidase YcbB/YkuD